MIEVTQAEIARLEDALLRLCPFRQWEVRQLTFPDEANQDLDIFHGLTPGGDERVVYSILQTSCPTTIYHDRSADRFPWSSNVIRLRSTTAGASVILLLAAMSSDAVIDPLDNPIDDTGGPLQYFPGSVGSTSEGYRTLLNPQSPSTAFSAGIQGPGLELTSDDDPEKDWAIVADTTWGGTDNPRLAFVSRRDGTGAANTNFAMALMSNAADTAGRFYLVPDGTAAGQLYLGDGGDIDGSASNWRITAIYAKTLDVSVSATLPGTITVTNLDATDIDSTDIDSTNGYTERGRSTKMGEWTSVAFSAGNFTGNASMTWTVASGDQTTFAYMEIGKTMFFSVELSGTTVGGTPDTELRIAIPNSRTAAKQMGGSFDAIDNGVSRAGRWHTNAAGTIIVLKRADTAAWTAATDATNISVEGFFEFQ